VIDAADYWMDASALHPPSSAAMKLVG